MIIYYYEYKFILYILLLIIIKEHLLMIKDTVKVYLLTAWVNRLNKYMKTEIFYDQIYLRKYLFYDNNL
jgi:hypothetical protein